MRYTTVCSGIEAPSVAWDSLDWKPVWFSQYDPEHDYSSGSDFASRVLAHHFPNVPNLGDMTRLVNLDTYQNEQFDLICGGTPCQSFSIAGLRKGLDDPRGNLMLTYLSIIAHKRPTWVVWENVPGVLSSNGGRDFGAFLGGLAECGYGWSYRVLDAQYFGVPQRRRRVFVVGYFGDWRPATAVLFERHSLSRNPPPSRKTGKEDTQIIGTITANGGGLNRPAGNANELDFCVVSANRLVSFGEYVDDGTSSTLKSRDAKDATDLIAYGIDEECNVSNQHFGPLLRGGDGGTRNAVAYINKTDLSTTLTMANSDTRAVHGLAVRRLTPVECERLQGFPDGWTDIKPNGKPTPDGLRYKALGNSMAVPVMRWLGNRIKSVNAIIHNEQNDFI